MKRLFLTIFSAFALSACLGTQAPAPVTHYGEKTGAGSAGIHSVVPGDTLWSISQRYDIAMKDIAIENKLSAPFMLETGQRLRLPPPRTYIVKPGDSVSEIARIFSTSPSQITRQNNLSAPYTIHAGQTLRLPSASAPITKTASKSSAPAKPGQKPSTTQSKPRSKIAAKTPARSSGKFLKPVNGKVISSFGPKKDSLHNDGINIAAPKGSPVRAAENGVVVYAGSELKGSGNLVLIRHQDQLMTAYAHMDSILIKRGDVLKRGQTLGTVGTTGSVDQPQLHFEVRRGTKAINPNKYL